MSGKSEKAYPILAHVASATGVMSLLRRRMAGSVIVLMYHKILPDQIAEDYPHGKLVIRKSVFAGQVAWLAKYTRVHPLRDALAAPDSDRPIVSLTFDDGYRDNAEIAAPLLESAGLRGTFFVTTGFIDGRPLWIDAVTRAHLQLGGETAANLAGFGEEEQDLDRFLDHLKRLPERRRQTVLADLLRRATPPPDDLVYAAMSPAQVASLADRGHEIGSHGMSHAMLPDLSPEEIENELAVSAARIREWTGKTPVGFCYPNGNSNPAVEEAVARAGYEYACSTTRGINRPEPKLFRLRRRLISEENSATAKGQHRDALFAGEVLGLNRTIRRALGRKRS